MPRRRLLGDVTYPTIEHAYWALRTTDPDVRAAVLAETNPYALAVRDEQCAWHSGLLDLGRLHA